MLVTELKQMKVWIPYRKVPEGDRVAKKPSLDGVRYAKWSNRNLLMSYDEANCLVVYNLRLAGIGFVIPEGYAVIDLDHCLSHNLVTKLNSYTETSPSGTGLHIIVKADLLEGFTKHTFVIDGQSVEVLLPNSFVTFTGNYISDEMHINDVTEFLLDIYKRDGIKARQEASPQLHNGGKKHECAYGATALRLECEEVRRATKNSRHDTILKAAVKIGSLIPCGHVDESEAVRDLERAGRATGKSAANVRETVRDGIKYGKAHPRHVKCSVLT